MAALNLEDSHGVDQCNIQQDHSHLYDLREQIGKGAFGSAFLALHKHSKKRFVLKRVRLARQTPWQRQCALQEMEMVAALDHPFIVPHHDSWVAGGHTVNIVYEYCENGDLTKFVKKSKDKPVSEDQLKLWLAEILLAVAYLKTQNIVHRDIKCSNIFVRSSGDLQLGDFGLATYRDCENRNQDYSLVGTPHTLSPEIICSESYSFKTDIWSLGCVFYELTAKKPPFDAFNLRGLMSKIRDCTPPPLPPTYSKGWERALKRMLRKDPDTRPSAQDLLDMPELQEAVALARRRGGELVESQRAGSALSCGSFPSTVASDHPSSRPVVMVAESVDSVPPSTGPPSSGSSTPPVPDTSCSVTPSVPDTPCSVTPPVPDTPCSVHAPSEVASTPTARRPVRSRASSAKRLATGAAAGAGAGARAPSAATKAAAAPGRPAWGRNVCASAQAGGTAAATPGVRQRRRTHDGVAATAPPPIKTRPRDNGLTPTAAAGDKATTAAPSEKASAPIMKPVVFAPAAGVGEGPRATARPASQPMRARGSPTKRRRQAAAASTAAPHALRTGTRGPPHLPLPLSPQAPRPSAGDVMTATPAFPLMAWGESPSPASGSPFPAPRDLPFASPTPPPAQAGPAQARTPTAPPLVTGGSEAALAARVRAAEGALLVATRLFAEGRWKDVAAVLAAAVADAQPALAAEVRCAAEALPPGLRRGAVRPGDHVAVAHGGLRRSADVMYCGPCHWDSGRWLGLTLEDPDGDCDGSRDGVRYFRAAPRHGLFVRASQVIGLADASSAMLIADSGLLPDECPSDG